MTSRHHALLAALGLLALPACGGGPSGNHTLRLENAGRAAGTTTCLAEVVAQVRSEKLGEVGEEFDRTHSVERALAVGSLDRILAAADLRPWLVAAVERGIARPPGRDDRTTPP